MKDSQIFSTYEKEIYNFAEDLYFKNKAMEDLIEVQEEKDLLLLKENEIAKFQEINMTIDKYCQPRIKTIIQTSEHPDSVADYLLVENQVDQLIQNYQNLVKLVKLVKKIYSAKGKNLPRPWQDMKDFLDKMKIAKIEQIKEDLKNLEN